MLTHFSDNKIQKIGILRALQLGDLLCAIPAVRALRNAYPHAEIVLLGLPWSASLVHRFPHYFNRYMHFPGFPGLPEQPFDALQFKTFLERILAEKFDLIVQMQGNGNLVNPMLELLGAKTFAGFFKAGNYKPDRGVFIEYPEDCHEIERHLRLMQALGAECAGTELEFPIQAKDQADLAQLQLQLPTGQYVILHPGARDEARQWPLSYFAELGLMAQAAGLSVVITGTAAEKAICDTLNSMMRQTAIDLAGRTTMGAVAALIKNAHTLISNCTGVAHIAAALQTPSLVISLNQEPKRWAPLNTHLHATFEWLFNPDMEAIKARAEYQFKQVRTAPTQLRASFAV